MRTINKPILATYCANCGISVITDEAINNLDIIYYAFGKTKDASIVFEFPEDLKKIQNIKKKHADLKIILSVNGGPEISKAVSTEEGFSKLTDNIFAAMINNGFDGVDIDWEYPTVNGRAEEWQLHTELIKALRKKINKSGKKYYLTAAVPTGEWTFKLMNLDESHQYLDYINVMTYDVNNPNFTSHHTAPYQSKYPNVTWGTVYGSQKVFKSHGISSEKLIYGVAYYSKLWSGIKSDSNGIGVPVSELPQYGPDITTLEKDYIDKNGYVRYWDDAAKAPFLYNGDTFITYDDADSITAKCDIITNENLGGIMIWEFAGDHEQKLVPYIRKYLNTHSVRVRVR